MPLKLKDPQQYFLQIMLNRSVIDEFIFKDLFRDVMEKFNIKYEEINLSKEYASFLKDINSVIRSFNMEIKKGIDEITGITFYCLIRLSDSASIGTLSNLYSTIELNIYKKILTVIIDSDDGYVSKNILTSLIQDEFDQLQTQAAQTSQSTKIPSLREIRLIIDKFIKDKWLVEVVDNNNMITLHGRAILELHDYISEMFSEQLINYCVICQVLVLCGISCNNCDNAKMHYHCAANVFKAQKNCKTCKNPFSDEQIENLRESIQQIKNTVASQSGL